MKLGSFKLKGLVWSVGLAALCFSLIAGLYLGADQNYLSEAKFRKLRERETVKDRGERILRMSPEELTRNY